jgi:hypothetical protein
MSVLIRHIKIALFTASAGCLQCLLMNHQKIVEIMIKGYYCVRIKVEHAINQGRLRCVKKKDRTWWTDPN